MPNHQALDGDVKLVLESDQSVATFKYKNCSTQGSGSSWEEALLNLHKKLYEQLRINPEMRRYFDDLVRDVCKQADLNVPKFGEEPVLSEN